MNRKNYRFFRILTVFFVSLVVSLSVGIHSYVLAFFGVITGILFLSIVRSKAGVIVDEREEDVRQKAAQYAYAVFAPTIAFASLALILFARDEYPYLQSIGIILAYLSCFFIGVYSIAYFILNRRYGGGKDEE